MSKNNKIINFQEKKAQMKKNIRPGTVVLHNNELNRALDEFRNNQSRDNMVTLLNMLINAYVLVTVKFDEQRRPLGMLIKDNNTGKMIQPVFTDNVMLPAAEKMAYQGVMKISFLDVIRSCSTNESISGDIIINCERHNITLRKDLLINVLKFADDNRDADGKYATITAEYLDKAMPSSKIIHKLENGRVVDVDALNIDPQETVEVKNQELNELVARCHNDFNPNNLDAVIKCLRNCRVLLPARMHNNGMPMPLGIMDPNNKRFQPIFGDKDQIPDNMNGQVTMNLPFMGVVKMMVENDNSFEGIIVNPKCGISIGKALLKQIYDDSTGGLPQSKRIDYERKVLPGQLFEDPEELFESLINQNAEYLYLDYESTLGGVESEFSESDYSVMIINPQDDIELAIIKWPNKALIPQAATDTYIVYNKNENKAYYFIWSLMADCKTKEVIEITQDMKSINHGPVPAEGSEMSWVLDKINK